MEVPVNYVAVLVAAAANMGLGFLWYGPLFGEMWKKEMGFTNESMKAMPLTPLRAMAGGLVGALLMSYVLSHLLVFASDYLATSGLPAGLSAGFWLWLGFALPITAGAFLWEGKSWRLWALNAGYFLVALLVMGAILSYSL
jgi:hypothetical protein